MATLQVVSHRRVDSVWCRWMIDQIDEMIEIGLCRKRSDMYVWQYAKVNE